MLNKIIEKYIDTELKDKTFNYQTLMSLPDLYLKFFEITGIPIHDFIEYMFNYIIDKFKDTIHPNDNMCIFIFDDFIKSCDNEINSYKIMSQNLLENLNPNKFKRYDIVVANVVRYGFYNALGDLCFSYFPQTETLYIIYNMISAGGNISSDFKLKYANRIIKYQYNIPIKTISMRHNLNYHTNA